LNKLCEDLDPTCMDIRWQLPKKMLLLQERLAETFDYSNDIFEKYIRKQCGLKVTQMRSKLCTYRDRDYLVQKE
jgi:hypothetical protein